MLGAYPPPRKKGLLYSDAHRYFSTSLITDEKVQEREKRDIKPKLLKKTNKKQKEQFTK